MDQSIGKILFALIRQEVCGQPIGDSLFLKGEVTQEMLLRLYSLAKAHDMAHLAASALQKWGLLGDDEISQRFKKQHMLSVYRCGGFQYELKQLTDTLEDAKIPFIPLKGAVIRERYPEAWMRTSCDIDILVHKKDLDAATAVLVERLGCTTNGRSSHDVQLYLPSGVHVELHFDLVEDARANFCRSVLEDCWTHTMPKAGYSYCLEFTDAMFYFYHIAHMAKHLEVGGCGIRPFLDVWVLDHLADEDCIQARDQLLLRGNLLTFANACRMLSQIWFEGKTHTETTLKLEEFVLSGGVYGNLKNKVAAQKKRSSNRFQYMMSRLFLPYDILKAQYVILEKHKWLFPIMQVRRWIHLLCNGRWNSAKTELSLNRSISEDEISDIEKLFDRIGLI